MERVILHSQRISYEKGILDNLTANTNPFELFKIWYDQAKDDVTEANAFSLSTCMNNRPSCRIVLLKEFNSSGFTFFTNYNSKKSQELLSNPNCAMTFHWDQRQIRIEGVAYKIDAADSDAYFLSRPRGSQIGAWVSNQSSVLKNRAELDEREREITARFKNDALVRPEFWGGFKIEPNKIEFWQGRPSRLHDRYLFTRSSSDQSVWDNVRLSP